VGVGAAHPKWPLRYGAWTKDAYLARITRGRLALYLDEMPEVICGDSLADISQDGIAIAHKLFDVVLTNRHLAQRLSPPRQTP